MLKFQEHVLFMKRIWYGYFGKRGTQVNPDGVRGIFRSLKILYGKVREKKKAKNRSKFDWKICLFQRRETCFHFEFTKPNK